MIVPPVPMVRMPRICAAPTVAVLAAAIATLAAVFQVLFQAAAVASVALTASDIHFWRVYVAVPPNAKPNDPDVADMPDRSNMHSKWYVLLLPTVSAPLAVALKSFCAAVCEASTYAAVRRMNCTASRIPR